MFAALCEHTLFTKDIVHLQSYALYALMHTGKLERSPLLFTLGIPSEAVCSRLTVDMLLRAIPRLVLSRPQ